MSLEKAKPSVPVMLAGQERLLCFDWWALSVIEEERGEEFLATLSDKMTLPKLFFLIWAGLLHNHSEFDAATKEKRRALQKQVFALCGKSNVSDLAAAVNEAMLRAEPAQRKNETSESEPSA